MELGDKLKDKKAIFISDSVATVRCPEIEHVALVGEHPSRADLSLIAPATTNTISKITYGIDTPVTSVHPPRLD